MRVYGGNSFISGHGQVRCIIAGTQKDAAKAINSGLRYIQQYWSVTGNKEELRVAQSKPGTLFWYDKKSEEWKEYAKT